MTLVTKRGAPQPPRRAGSGALPGRSQHLTGTLVGALCDGGHAVTATAALGRELLLTQVFEIRELPLLSQRVERVVALQELGRGHGSTNLMPVIARITRR